MPKFSNNVDFSQFQLLNATLQILASDPSTPVQGQFWFNSTSKSYKYYDGTSTVTIPTTVGGGGTVTSVAMTVPSWLAVSGSPITTSGTLALSAATGQSANQFLATPNGSSGALGLRAIVAADVPKTLDHTWVTDFDTQVRTSRLDQMAAPTASVSMNSQKLTNLLDPTAAQDAATKNYVDAAIQGTPTKPAAAYATTGALPANTYANGSSGVGATLTGTSNGALAAIDGQTPAAGDVVLVKNEATASHNGLYTVTQLGDGTHPYILTRHADMDVSAEFGGGLIAVENGTTNGGALFLCTTNAPTVGTTAISFTELNKATDLQAGTGITISGNTISVATNYAGGSSIVTVGTITAGTWQGTAVGIAYGGTGATTAAGARGNIGALGKYSQLVGNGSATSFAITQATHGLASDGTNAVATYDASTGARVYPDESVNPANGTVTVTFGAAPATNAYRVVITG